jgi:hypothetical protein
LLIERIDLVQTPEAQGIRVTWHPLGWQARSLAAHVGDSDPRPPAWLDPRGERELARVLAALLGPAPAPGVLLRAAVAGYAYYVVPGQTEALRPGDPVELIREPDNPADPDAIALHWQGQKIGYVPRDYNQPIAQRLDAGQAPRCQFTGIAPEQPPWRQVMFEIRA